MIYQGRTSLIKYWYLIGMGILFVMAGIQLIYSPGAGDTGFFFVLPGLFSVGLACLNVAVASYTVTSRRLIGRKGLLPPRTVEVEISDIQDVQVNQNPTERILGIGNIAVSTPDPSGLKIVFAGIRNPEKVAGMIPERRTKVGNRKERPRVQNIR